MYIKNICYNGKYIIIRRGDHMPFTTVKTQELIKDMKQKDAEFAKQWDESRNEYKLIQEELKPKKQ